MKLAGWNDLPRGYGAHFDTALAPIWLRILYATPFLDRFAYPQLVRRGLGFLAPHPGLSATELDPVIGGWQLENPHHRAPGSVAWLHPDGDKWLGYGVLQCCGSMPGQRVGPVQDRSGTLHL